MKSVSVHVVTYNSVDYIDACLKAVLSQRHPVMQVVVIDNASTDGTAEVLHGYSSQVEVVLNDVNVGFAAGHNQAIRRTNADYCLILNPDVILHPDYLHELLSYLNMHNSETIGSLTGKLLLQADHTVVDSCGITINKARRAFDLGNGEDASGWIDIRDVFGVSGAAALYSRAMIHDISIDGEFFDESFFAYKEDVDVSWRAQLFGWQSYFVPDAVAYHERGWKTGGRKNQPLFIRRLSYINRYRMLYKNDQWPAVMKHLPSILAYEAAAAAYTLLREPQLLAAWRGFLQDWQRLRHWRSEVNRRAKKRKNVYTYFN